MRTSTPCARSCPLPRRPLSGLEGARVREGGRGSDASVPSVKFLRADDSGDRVTACQRVAGLKRSSSRRSARRAPGPAAPPDASLCQRSAFAPSTKRLTSGSERSSIATPVARCVLTLTYYTWIGLQPESWESRRTPHAAHLNFRELRFGEVPVLGFLRSSLSAYRASTGQGYPSGVSWPFQG